MKTIFVLLAALTLLLSVPTVAGAELSAKGDLFVRFDGGIAPDALPRDSLAPIAVRIEGSVRTLAGAKPPAVRQIEIALNKGGRLETSGLPVCRRGQIKLTTPAEALAACGSALVGGGGFAAQTTFLDQTSAVFPGDILLFNSVSHGHPVILAHISQRDPAPITQVAVFHIRHRRGTFGTIINAELPEALGRNGYLKSIFLQLQRHYVFRGEKRSYLSASCGAPVGFSGASFPLARAAMSFSDGRTLESTLTRTCKVR